MNQPNRPAIPRASFRLPNRPAMPRPSMALLILITFGSSWNACKLAKTDRIWSVNFSISPTKSNVFSAALRQRRFDSLDDNFELTNPVVARKKKATYNLSNAMTTEISHNNYIATIKPTMSYDTWCPWTMVQLVK